MEFRGSGCFCALGIFEFRGRTVGLGGFTNLGFRIVGFRLWGLGFSLRERAW